MADSQTTVMFVGVQLTLVGVWVLGWGAGSNAALLSALLVALGTILVPYPVWSERMDRLP